MTIKFQSPFFWATFCLVAVISQSRSFDKNDEVSIEDLVLEFLDNYDEEASKLMNEMTIASWNYETNITDYNADIATQKSLEVRCKFIKGHLNYPKNDFLIMAFLI